MRYKRTPLNETSQQFMTGILKCIGFFTIKLRTFSGTRETQAYKCQPSKKWILLICPQLRL